MLASVRDLLRETDHGLRGDLGRYEGLTAFDVWLAEQTGDTSWLDEETGSVDFGVWSGRIGRRIVQEDDRGFVYVTRFTSEEAARKAFDQESQAYGAWVADETEDFD